MFKKVVLTWALALGLALTPVLALAQAPAAGTLPPEVAAALAKEKPLTQADIDAYLKILPQLGAVAQDNSAVAKLYQDAGFTELRFNYAVGKIGLGMALAAGATNEQMGMEQIPEVLRPSDAEVALVKKNIDKLQAAAMEMAISMQNAQ